MENKETQFANETPGPEQPINNMEQMPAQPVTPMEPMPVQPAEPMPAQPVEQTPVQPVEPIPAQPVEQMPAQPMEQSPMQPMGTMGQMPTQPIMSQPMAGELPMPMLDGDDKKAERKRKLIIGCSIGGIVAVIALIAVFLIVFLGHGERIVSCTANKELMGITMNGEENYRVKDGGLSGGDMSISVDLKNMQDSYKEREKDLVDMLAEQYKTECEDHCVFDYDYIEGDSVKYTMEYDETGINDVVYSYGIENMSAQEIADKIQEETESSDITCTQR